jgi:hypothetical protein
MTSRRLWLLRALLLLPLVPLAAGRRMVTYQDAIMTHLPAKAATVEQIRAGVFPFLNPYASFGEPLAGNPNFGTFFPDMLLFLALPLPVAFGLRFALAAVLAYAGARRWARAEGFPRGSAEVAAVAFALSGVYVSTWRFFNSGLALALAPWVMAAAARLSRRAGVDAGADAGASPRRRATAELALVAALEVLAGEPVIAFMTFALALARGAAGAWRSVAWTALGLALAAAVAAPQIASTAQVYVTSTRSLAPFPYLLASSTSVTPARLLEQVTPYPFGRPDRTGEAGFTGHEHYDNHAPYLWTLHVGWITLALLLLCAQPRDRGERWWWALLALAVVLSMGRYMPGGRWIHPLLSLGGRVRFPVKWWYVVALALVPLVARAAQRWEDGPPLTRGARVRLAVALVVGLVALATLTDASGIAAVGAGASTAAVVVLWLFSSRDRRPSAEGLAWLAALTLALADVPLWRTLVDVVPDPPPRFAGGRVYERAAGEPHPLPHAPDWPPPEPATREIFRRAPRELWALTGALSGMPYAFDGDPDGIYFEGDRVVAKSIDGLPWDARAPALRASGVGYVVSAADLPPPFARLAVLGPEHGVALYRLEGGAPSVRVATRVVTAVRFQDVVPLLSRPDFDALADAVVPGPIVTILGARTDSRVDVRDERPDRLRARVDALAPAVLVWSRTFFRAWRARVDGRPAETLVADGHLLGVRVPAGAHEVDVVWSTAPVLAAVVLSLAALGVLVVLRRC